MSDLHLAARAAGLAREWEDAEGRAHQVDDAVLAAVLARLDLAPPTTPFVCAVAGRPVAIGGTEGAGEAELVLEDGTRRVLPVTDGWLAGIDAIGYHDGLVAGRRFTLAVAPPRCPPVAARGWAAAVQIPALREPQPRGFGDYGALADAARRFGRAGASALAISPTHALFPADPTRFSPYSPSTRLFHNVALADPRAIGVSLPSQPDPDLIDWPNATHARLAALRAAFDTADECVHAAVAAFRTARGPALEAHARFDALHARFGGGGWPDWPTELHDPDGDAVHRFAAACAADVAFYAFLQWLADRNLADAQAAAREEMGVGLIADLAVGMDGGGSHGWSAREDLLQGMGIGAPPDPLGPDGQSWGIAALDPFALRRSGFAPFIATLRAALPHAGGIRIDHALGLDRLWVIPEGGTAADGVYLAMPGEAMKHIVAIEAHRAGGIVIAEDLGTVPPGFRDDLAARGMYGMAVLPFERDDAGGFVDPAGWRREAVAMTGTHDTPTLAGWWRGRDLDWAARLGRGLAQGDDARRRAQRDDDRAALWRAVGDGGEASPVDPPIDAILASVADAPGPLLIVPVEDLAGIDEQPNLPGTTTEHPNWRRRLPATTAALLAEPAIARRTAILTSKRPG